MVRALAFPVTARPMPLCGELNPDSSCGVSAIPLQDRPAGIARQAAVHVPGLPAPDKLYALRRNKCFIAGDIGCYTLASAAPDAIDTCLCMVRASTMPTACPRCTSAGGQSWRGHRDSTVYHTDNRPAEPGIQQRRP
jgi:hypothetical protein